MNRVIAILASSTAANAATADLVAAGIPADSIETACGEEGLRTVDFTGERHGLLARMFRAIQGVGELAEYKDRFEQALRGGECLLVVDAAAEPIRRVVHQLLKACGAHFRSSHGRASRALSASSLMFGAPSANRLVPHLPRVVLAEGNARGKVLDTAHDLLGRVGAIGPVT